MISPKDARDIAFDLVRTERIRQISEEGFTQEHDSQHSFPDALAYAAATYALPENSRRLHKAHPDALAPNLWPWDPQYYKPTPDDRLRELTKATALLLAEMERLLTEPQ